MPSIVPPGYTRGPILHFAGTTEPLQEERLLQFYWDQAGAFGARIIVIIAGQQTARGVRLEKLLRVWETATVTIAHLTDRRSARTVWPPDDLEEATGILLVTEDALATASLIGGTALAQAIRRKNARGAAVCAAGRGGAIICQHMIVPPPTWIDPDRRQEIVTFAPGLGLINRLAIDGFINDISIESKHAHETRRRQRLQTAVAHNPFLLAASLTADCGIVVYADSTLEVFGTGTVYLMQGDDPADEALDAAATSTTMEPAHGLQLTCDHYFNMDDRTIRPKDDDDIPRQGYETSAF